MRSRFSVPLAVALSAMFSFVMLTSCSTVGVVAFNQLSNQVLKLEKQQALADSVKQQPSAVDALPAGLSQYSYAGQRIQPNNRFCYELYMHINNDEKKSVQGAAAYGNYLFQFFDHMPRVAVVNLQSKEIVQDLAMKETTTYHCNNANFGSERFDAADEFPLLYVSMENKAEHKCLVYRVTGEAGSFALSLVQTIIYPEVTEIPLYYPNAIIDSENGYLWLTGYEQENWHAAEGNKTKYLKFRLPKLADGDVTLKAADAIERYEYTAMTATQGAICRGGKIYQMYDVGPPSAYLRVFNGGKLESEVKLHECGLPVEPENIFWYDGHLYYTTVRRDIYKLYF